MPQHKWESEVYNKIYNYLLPVSPGKDLSIEHYQDFVTFQKYLFWSCHFSKLSVSSAFKLWMLWRIPMPRGRNKPLWGFWHYCLMVSGRVTLKTSFKNMVAKIYLKKKDKKGIVWLLGSTLAIWTFIWKVIHLKNKIWYLKSRRNKEPKL